MKRSIISGIVSILLLAMLWGVMTHRQYLYDWVTVQQFSPTAEVSRIATRASMSDRGKFLFYASRPEVDGAKTFNANCERRETSAAILGCYTGTRIYLYQIANQELDGIEEVTAAHEMLHAAWNRMSASDQKTIGDELERVYQQKKTPALEDRLKYYDRQEPGERRNELHSIMGTELSGLGDKLEQHYRQYFTDRSAVVTLHQSYEAVFTNLEHQSERLQSEINQMATSINAAIAAYNKAIDTLNTDTAAHNQALSSVDRSDARAVATYNAASATLRSRRDTLRVTQQELASRKATYDEKIREYNALSIKTADLTSSIDSFQAEQQ